MYFMHLKDLGQNAVIEGMNSLMLAGVVGELPETKYTDAFRPLFHRDLTPLTGVSESLVRLLAPSSIESSKKRLDGGLDACSV